VRFLLQLHDVLIPPLQTPRTAPPNRTYICREFTDGATYIIALHPIKLPIMLRLSFYLLHATDPDSIAALLYDTGAGIMQPTSEPNAASWLLQLDHPTMLLTGCHSAIGLIDKLAGAAIGRQSRGGCLRGIAHSRGFRASPRQGTFK
jgi:hypothetical protein